MGNYASDSTFIKSLIKVDEKEQFFKKCKENRVTASAMVRELIIKYIQEDSTK